MPIDESVDPARSDVLTLAVRRPGHAAMRHLLDELERGHHGDSVPAHLQSWHTGAEGEVLVGHELARLSSEWRVLHAIPVGQNADIDHLVIGPSGIFVLNTKRHPGKKVTVGTHVVWINGSQTNGYQRNLRERALKVGAALRSERVPDLAVDPLLVFVDALRLLRRDEQTVASVSMASLVAHLQGLPVRLDPEQIEHLFVAASQPSTWGRSAAVLRESDPTPRFLQLTAVLPSAPSRESTRTSRTLVTRGPQRRKAVRAPSMALGCLGAVLLAVAAPVSAVIGIGLLSTLTQMLMQR